MENCATSYVGIYNLHLSFLSVKKRGKKEEEKLRHPTTHVTYHMSVTCHILKVCHMSVIILGAKVYWCWDNFIE